MSILKVARMGHPVLRLPAQPVPVGEIGSPRVQNLIRDMVETMRDYRGIGLAAPQVFKSLQIIVIEAMSRAETPTSLTVLINPSTTVVTEQIDEDWEGCLSIPDLRGLVPRYRGIRVHACGPSGELLELRAEGFLARVIQHEHDHLVGKLFLDRMRDFQSLSYLDEFMRYKSKPDERSSP